MAVGFWEGTHSCDEDGQPSKQLYPMLPENAVSAEKNAAGGFPERKLPSKYSRLRDCCWQNSAGIPPRRRL